MIEKARRAAIVALDLRMACREIAAERAPERTRRLVGLAVRCDARHDCRQRSKRQSMTRRANPSAHRADFHCHKSRQKSFQLHLHIGIVWPAATFGYDPVDILRRVL